MRLNNSATMRMKASTDPRWQEVPRWQRADELWAYYENNGVYDMLRQAGQIKGNGFLKSLRNPAQRAVEWYASTVWGGPLKTTLVIEAESDQPNLIPAIHQLWRWSNFSVTRQQVVRDAAVSGEAFIKIAQPENGAKRVYLQRLDGNQITKYKVDERGYIKECRIDVALGNGQYQTEQWDNERVRVWKHKKGRKSPLSELGTPDETPLSEWGIDFVPIVRFPHLIIRNQPAGAFELALEKIDEANRQASKLHGLLFRHNDAHFALESNMLDATGRPLPPPVVDSSAKRTDEDGNQTVELGGDKLLRLPGMAKLTSMVPNLKYGDALKVLNAQMAEIDADLPEIMWHSLKTIPDLSGKALRLIMSPARSRTLEVRGNHEDALVRAHMIALTIGQAIGAFSAEIGSYEKGDFEHHFAVRPVLPLSREEIAELASAETGAGIPLNTSLRQSGWTDAQLESMQEERDLEQAAQRETLAAALLNAQSSFDGGLQSDGLE